LFEIEGKLELEAVVSGGDAEHAEDRDDGPAAERSK
jgi:hypothetical protein